MRTILTFALVFLATACTKKEPAVSADAAPAVQMDPDTVVRRFIELSAGAKTMEDKGKLERLCTGEMRAAFQKMTDETFQLSYLGNRIRIKDFTLLDTARKEDGARVRYRIAVENSGGSDTTQEKTEREVDLINKDGVWLIEAIRLRATDKVLFENGMLF